jgi:membrane associated rhomboid family serine protease
MIPVRDHSRPRVFPFITWLILAVNTFMFFYMFTLPRIELLQFVEEYSMIPAEIVRGENLHTLFTSMFLHASIGHIFSNMIFLHVFGDNLEERFGHLGYLVFYLFCGLAASALQIAVNPLVSIPNLGASGAIAGLLGGYMVLYPRNRIDVLIPLGVILKLITVPAYVMLFFWIAYQFLLGLGTLGIGGGVAYFAHIGGFLAGLIVCLISRIRRPVGRFATTG